MIKGLPGINKKGSYDPFLSVLGTNFKPIFSVQNQFVLFVSIEVR